VFGARYGTRPTRGCELVRFDPAVASPVSLGASVSVGLGAAQVSWCSSGSDGREGVGDGGDRGADGGEGVEKGSEGVVVDAC
jgi:hypothetical protein